MPMLPSNATALSTSFHRTTKGSHLKTAVRNTVQDLAKLSDMSRLNRPNLLCLSHIKREYDDVSDFTAPSPIVCVDATVTRPSSTRRSSTEHGHDLDDSLTNLQWLQAVSVDDILEGKPVTYAPLSPAPSSCSDDGKENDEKRFGKRSRDLRHSYDSTIDYRLNPKVKPPYSYAALIIMAMKANGTPKMTLSEIYRWISGNFVYFKFADPSWQNSIRHNLSLNKCFTKMPRKRGDPGKGGYWCIVPEYANKLLENSIRKRRASMLDYNCQDLYKRQKLDTFENRLLGRLQSEPAGGGVDVEAAERDVNNNSKLVGAFKEAGGRHRRSESDDVFGDFAHCQLDHAYGREPVVLKPPELEADHIRAIAENLQFSTTYLECNVECAEPLSTSQIFNTFADFMRADCRWSSETDNEVSQDDCFEESMQRVTAELLAARKVTANPDNPFPLTKSMGGRSGESPFLQTRGIGACAASPCCLSPPLSADDVSLSDDDDTIGMIDSVRFIDAPDLTIRGVSVKLHEVTASEVDAGLLTTQLAIMEESQTAEVFYSS